MKITATQTNILTNSNQTIVHKIKSSAKAFKLLSDGLYSNKIEAIVRELCCNALDSNKQANNDQPFKVFLPTEIEPVFRVVDDGIGIHDSKIGDIYCTYFGSTKDDDNDYIGAFGLGSKSPLCYVDMFTVISRFDNIKTVYSIHLNEEGAPNLTKLTESKTLEKNGLEVQVPVKKNDISTFSRITKRVLSYFETQPIVYYQDTEITINNFFEDKDTKKISNDYFLNNNNFFDLYKKIYAWMGNIIYPIKIENVINMLSDTSLIAKLQNIEKLNIKSLLIKFKLGDLNINPNREALSYDKTTCENIAKKIIYYYDKYIIEKLKNDFKHAKNKRDVFDIYNNYGYYSIEGKLIRISENIMYKNKKVKDILQEVYYLTCITNKDIKIDTRVFTYNQFKNTLKQESGYLGKNRLKKPFTIDQIENYAYWFESKNKYLKYIRLHISNKNIKPFKILFVGIYNKNLKIDKETQFLEFKKLCKLVEIDSIVTINDIKKIIPKSTQQSKLKSSKQKFKFYSLSGHELDVNEQLNILNTKDTTKICYVETYRNKPINYFIKQDNICYDLKNEGYTILFIPKPYIEVFKKEYPLVSRLDSLLNTLLSLYKNKIDNLVNNTKFLIEEYLFSNINYDLYHNFKYYDTELVKALYGKPFYNLYQKDLVGNIRQSRTHSLKSIELKNIILILNSLTEKNNEKKYSVCEEIENRINEYALANKQGNIISNIININRSIKLYDKKIYDIIKFTRKSLFSK